MNKKQVVRQTANYTVYRVGSSLRAKGRTAGTGTYKSGYVTLAESETGYVLNCDAKRLEADLAMVGA